MSVSEVDFRRWQADRERLYAEIERLKADVDRMARLAIDNAREMLAAQEEAQRLRVALQKVAEHDVQYIALAALGGAK